MTNKQYTSDWNIRLKELKPKLVFAVNGPAVLTDHVKELRGSLKDSANLGHQIGTWLVAEAKMKSAEADDRVVDDPEIDRSDANTPATGN